MAPSSQSAIQYYLPIRQDITIPKLTRTDNGKYFFSYKRLSAIDRFLIHSGNFSELVQLTQSLLLNLKDFVSTLLDSRKPDAFHSITNWKVNILDTSVHNFYFLFFNQASGIFKSRIREPFHTESGGYTLPVNIYYDNNNFNVSKIIIWDKNMQKHVFTRNRIADNDPKSKWALEHVFHTLTYESVYSHLGINHALSIYSKYQVLKNWSEHYRIDEFDYIANNGTIQPYIGSISTSTNIPFALETTIRNEDKLIFDDGHEIVAMDNFKLVKRHWSFNTLKTKRKLNPFQEQLFGIQKTIDRYILLHYPTLSKKRSKYFALFLLHSCAISSFMHPNTSSPYMATHHSGTIDTINIYGNYTLGEIIAYHTAAEDALPVPFVEMFLPSKIRNLLNELKSHCHDPKIIPGLSHYIPLFLSNPLITMLS